MPPNSEINNTTGVLFEADGDLDDGGLKHDVRSLHESDKRENVQYVWLNLILFPVTHIIAVYGCYLIVVSAHIYTCLFTFGLYWFTMLGLLAGIHRLWSHRSYKASNGLQLFLMLGCTMAYQNSIFHWVREHRVHHKFSETNADPVNASRGLFFSHVGWLMVRKHPDVKTKGKVIDMSDLEQNPIVAFNRKHYVMLTTLVAGVIPFIIPVLGWNETFINSFCIAVVLRWVLTLNAIFVVNSFAHKYGHRPIDANIEPRQNVWVSLFTGGEGWHNFHHSFPWDYKASEHGFINMITPFIDLCAFMGWAWDLKSVAPDVVRRRMHRTGDGSHSVWGWNDPDQCAEERAMASVTYRKEPNAICL